MTVAACSRPGWRESRSIGPEIDTAAMTRPEGERTGADTEATPGSRSPTLCAQPRRRTPDSAVAVNAAPCRPRCSRSGSSHASSTWAAEPARMDSVAPTGIESRRPTGRSAADDADPVLALAAEELGALAGVVAQRAEHRAGGREQAVLAGGRGELAEARAEDEAPLQVAGRRGGGARARRPAGGRSGGPGRWRVTSWARVDGPASSALSTIAALSSTPTPLVLSMS